MPSVGRRRGLANARGSDRSSFRVLGADPDPGTFVTRGWHWRQVVGQHLLPLLPRGHGRPGPGGWYPMDPLVLHAQLVRIPHVQLARADGVTMAISAALGQLPSGVVGKELSLGQGLDGQGGHTIDHCVRGRHQGPRASMNWP